MAAADFEIAIRMRPNWYIVHTPAPATLPPAQDIAVSSVRFTTPHKRLVDIHSNIHASAALTTACTQSTESVAAAIAATQQTSRASRTDRAYVTPFVSTVCGAIGGAISTIATNPLDVVRTRLQASRVSTQHMGSKSMVETMRILIASGVKGMATGLSPNLAASVPARSMYFLFYSQSKTVASRCTDHAQTQTALAALLSMCGVTLCMNPLFVLRVRAQLQPEQTVRSIAAHILKSTGVLGFYRGMACGIAGRSFENVCYWLLYEQLKQSRALKQSSLAGDASNASRLQTAVTLPLQIFGASLVAKTAASVASYPHMVVQTHIREVDPITGKHPYTGIWRTTKSVWRADGVRGFYAGLTPHLVRVLPSTGLAFLVYEMTVRGLGYST